MYGRNAQAESHKELEECKMERKSSVHGIVLLVILIALVIYTYIEIFRTQGYQFIAIALPSLILVWSFTINFGKFWNRIKGKGFITRTGIKGTIMGKQFRVDNDRMGYYVCFFTEDVDDKMRELRVGGFYSFLDMLSGRVTIPMIGRVHQFRDLGAYSEDTSGCIEFDGSVSGTPLPPERQLQLDRETAMRNSIVAMNSLISKAWFEVEVLSQMENKQTAKVAQRLKSMVRDLKGNVQQILQSGGYPPMNQGGQQQ